MDIAVYLLTTALRSLVLCAAGLYLTSAAYVLGLAGPQLLLRWRLIAQSADSRRRWTQWGYAGWAVLLSAAWLSMLWVLLWGGIPDPWRAMVSPSVAALLVGVVVWSWAYTARKALSDWFRREGSPPSPTLFRRRLTASYQLFWYRAAWNMALVGGLTSMVLTVFIPALHAAPLLQAGGYAATLAVVFVVVRLVEWMLPNLSSLDFAMRIIDQLTPGTKRRRPFTDWQWHLNSTPFRDRDLCRLTRRLRTRSRRATRLFGGSTVCTPHSRLAALIDSIARDWVSTGSPRTADLIFAVRLAPPLLGLSRRTDTVQASLQRLASAYGEAIDLPVAGVHGMKRLMRPIDHTADLLTKLGVVVSAALGALLVVTRLGVEIGLLQPHNLSWLSRILGVS